MCKMLAQSYIDIIVNTLTKIDKPESEAEKNKFAENSIQDTLEILDICKKEKGNLEKAYNAFLNIIKAFLSFYAGISKSGPERMSYEFEKSIKDLADTKEWQEKIENDFFLGVFEKANKLSKKFITGNAVEIALKELWDFANEEFKFSNAVLARAPINKDKLEEIFTYVKGNIIFSNINFDGKIKSYDFKQASSQEGLIIECLIKVVKFLIGDYESSESNEDYDKNNYMGYKEYAQRVIYPQIVTYAKHRVNGDANNCLIMDHAGAFAKWHGGEVQILTEFKYCINNSYYALPNMNRLDIEWWVNPILIPCHEFDMKINEAKGEGIK